MYQNKVTLIGFLGSNAEALNNSRFTALSLATKSFHKKNGGYTSHTKGAHIQVEGELRSREYDSKKTESRQRVWDRVSSILTLDRTEKSAPEDQDVEPREDIAA